MQDSDLPQRLKVSIILTGPMCSHAPYCNLITSVLQSTTVGSEIRPLETEN